MICPGCQLFSKLSVTLDSTTQLLGLPDDQRRIIDGDVIHLDHLLAKQPTAVDEDVDVHNPLVTDEAECRRVVVVVSRAADLGAVPAIVGGRDHVAGVLPDVGGRCVEAIVDRAKVGADVAIRSRAVGSLLKHAIAIQVEPNDKARRPASNPADQRSVVSTQLSQLLESWIVELIKLNSAADDVFALCGRQFERPRLGLCSRLNDLGTLVKQRPSSTKCRSADRRYTSPRPSTKPTNRNLIRILLDQFGPRNDRPAR